MSDKSLAESIFGWAKLAAFLFLVIYLIFDYVLVGHSDYASMEPRARAVYCDGAQSIAEKVHRFLRCMEINSFAIAGIGATIDYDQVVAQADNAAETVGLVNNALDRIKENPATESSAEIVALLENARDRSTVAVEQLEATARVAESATLSDADKQVEWLMVMGADKTMPQAQAQRNSVAAVVGQMPGLLRRGTFLRSALVYPSRAAAQAAYDRFEPLLRYGAILRGYDDFCPDREPGVEEGVDLIRCGET